MSKKHTPPTAEQIRAARNAAGLTQDQSAQLVYHNIRTWQKWEKPTQAMHPAIYELYLLKTEQKTIRQAKWDARRKS